MEGAKEEKDDIDKDDVNKDGAYMMMKGPQVIKMRIKDYHNKR